VKAAALGAWPLLGVEEQRQPPQQVGRPVGTRVRPSGVTRVSGRSGQPDGSLVAALLALQKTAETADELLRFVRSRNGGWRRFRFHAAGRLLATRVVG